MTFEGKDKFNASVNSTCAQPPHLPQATAGPFAGLVSPGGAAFANFSLPRGPGICQPRGHSLSNTRAVSHQNVTTQRVLLGKKKRIGSSVKDRKKLNEGCKGMFSI